MIKNKIHLIFFISFALFLFLVGFLVLPRFIDIPEIKKYEPIKQSEEKDTETNEQEAEIVEDILPLPPEKNSPIDTSINNKNIDGCLNIEDAESKKQCIALVAQQLKDSDLCKSLSEEDLINNCEDKVNYKKATTENDISFCLDIKNNDYSQSCVIKLIESKDDIENKDCETLPEREKKYCLDYLVSVNDYSVYNNSQKIEDCNAIINEGIKEFCLFKFSE